MVSVHLWHLWVKTGMYVNLFCWKLARNILKRLSYYLCCIMCVWIVLEISTQILCSRCVKPLHPMIAPRLFRIMNCLTKLNPRGLKGLWIIWGLGVPSGHWCPDYMSYLKVHTAFPEVFAMMNSYVTTCETIHTSRIGSSFHLGDLILCLVIKLKWVTYSLFGTTTASGFLEA